MSENNDSCVYSRSEYDEFMDKYEKDHALCPKCGSDDFSTTLVGYMFDREHPEDYKDENECVCSDCGDKHIFHDRVPQL